MFSWRPAPDRFAARLTASLAAGVLALLLAALVPIRSGAPAAHAHGPDGGYYGIGKSGEDGLKALWSAARTPLRWLRQSNRNFQSLMRLLAERSARQGDPDAPPPLPSKRPPEEAVEEEEPPRQSIYGGEAGAGRDKGGTRVKEWHKRATKAWPQAPLSSCRLAGVPVRRGGWYVVQKGDTLWHIAELHYGYGGAYPRLRRANSARVPDANLIHPCQRLYIPRWRCCGFADRTEPETPVVYDAGGHR